MVKLLPIIVIVIVAIGILTGLSKQIFSALESSKRLDTETERVTKLADENKKLKTELEKAESDESFEKTLRNELNMGKPGETVVVIPPEVITQVLESQKPPPPEPKLPNWQGWLKLFTH
jgi:cell division protein FtsB